MATREVAAHWIADQVVPAGKLVSSAQGRWVPVVRDAMIFVVLHLSAARLAPKLLEQAVVPSRTRPEKRLLLLISKVPGLQKLGQVLARNRQLRPALHRALVQLENSIRDTDAAEIARLIQRELENKIQRFDVRFRPAILSEASVSAVVRFTWRNPQSGHIEHGVFKVLKPYVSEFFAEDMNILQGLADYFGARLDSYGLGGETLGDTFTKVRRLLEHEVDFRGEQRTLAQAAQHYETLPSIRIPRVFNELCTDCVTAMSEERGQKVTIAARHLTRWHRARLAGSIMQALVVDPLFSNDDCVLFHADPHAGNLLYDPVRGKLAILDWALTERLSREHRRHLVLLVMNVGLRNSPAAIQHIEALRQHGVRNQSIDTMVSQYIQSLPLQPIPRLSDGMRLLEQLAMHNVKFPSSLIMLAKVLLTLDGVVHDLCSGDVNLAVSSAQYLVTRIVRDRKLLASPIRTTDWLSLELSGLLFTMRLGICWQEVILQALFTKRSRLGVA